MTLKEVIERFENPKRNANGSYNVTCPCHDDKTQSLTISSGDNGGIVMHDHAGCDNKDILKAKGLSFNDLFPNTEPRKPVETVYKYFDTDGTLLHETVRIEPGKQGRKKDFFQRRPNGKGGYIWSLKGAKTVLYRLPELIKAIEEGKPVLLVEGEKDAANLARLGFCATTNAGGAKQWRTDYTKALKGADIVVFPDNDKPGLERAQNLAAELESTAKSVRIADLLSVEPKLKPKGDISDIIQGKQDAAQIVKTLIETATKPKKPGVSEESESKSQADCIMQASTELEFFIDQMDEVFARVKLGEAWENIPINSTKFNDWLTYHTRLKSGVIVGRDALQKAVGLLTAQTRIQSSSSETLHNRIAPAKDGILYDLLDEKKQAIVIAPSGWNISEQAKPPFRRYPHQKAQFTPTSGGSAWDIFKHINILEDRRLLFLCYLTSLFIPSIAHPILVLHGEKGAAKSTTTRMIKAIIDPSSIDTSAFPKDDAEMLRKLNTHWLSCFDNISRITQSQSDMLCRATTGVGMSARKLYTNDDEIHYYIKRPIILNGINVVATRADLLDRSLMMELSRIDATKRKTDSEVWGAFYEDLPAIFGAILDVLCIAITKEKNIHLDRKTRMADFNHWGAAIAESLQENGAKDFVEQLDADEERRNEEAISSDSVASSIQILMESSNSYRGSASELLSKLRGIAVENCIPTTKPSFPDSPNGLTRRINGIKSNLELIGINYQLSRNSRRREIVFERDLKKGRL